MIKLFSYISLILLSAASLAQPNDYYTHKNFNLLHDFFEYERDLKKFMDIKPGEIIADVGGDDGHHMGALSLIYDSLTFYIEDLNPKTTIADIEKMKMRFSKKKTTPQTCQFNWVLGTSTASNLPDAVFDKIIMIVSFHEFSEVNAMVKDLSKKLKPNGKIYIFEILSIDKELHCVDKHRCYSMKETNEIMNQHGFYQTRQSSPESGIINYANILVFEKDKEKSDLFFKQKEMLQPYIEKSLLLAQPSVASSVGITGAIADSILPKVNDIANLYNVYEAWLKNIGTQWMTKKEYEYAINVFTVLIKLFPNSGFNYFLLAEAHESNEQPDLADLNYAKACQLGYKARTCTN